MMGLGPNQLTWLRRNIGSFKDAEEQRYLARQDAVRAARLAGLTAREVQILEHIAQGLDNAQIAARLELSEKTVRNHITHIFDKIGVESRAQAIVLARERGLGQRSRPL
jgi:DNA-binding NarL/FixJ family response regulator